MGCSNCVRAEERWNTLVLCWLPKVKCGDRTQLLPRTQNRWLCWLARRRTNLFLFWTQIAAIGKKRLKTRIQKKLHSPQSKDCTYYPAWHSDLVMHLEPYNAPWTLLYHQLNGYLLCCIWVTSSSLRELQTNKLNMWAQYYHSCTEKHSRWTWRNESYSQNKIDCLGHVMRPGRLELPFHTSDAIRDLRPPRLVAELKSFLGLYNAYGRFVPDSARIVSPLNAMLKRGKPIQLDNWFTE